jgi:hypothetical protein
MDSLVLVYFAYAIGTGEYQYIQFFSWIYIYLISYLFMVSRQGNYNVKYSESRLKKIKQQMLNNKK